MVGNTPNFSRFDVMRCFLAIRENKSRMQLSSELELGEGTIRTILGLLKAKKLAYSTRQGHSYTKKGEGLARRINGVMEAKEFRSERMFAGGRKIAVLLRNKTKADVSYKQRDIAIQHGANAAMILVYRKSRLIVPGMEKFDASEIKKLFEMEENNIVVVTAARSYRVAFNSGIAVCTELNDVLRSISRDFEQ